MLLPMETCSLASETVGPILRAISQDVPDLETELLHLCHLRTLRLPGPTIGKASSAYVLTAW